MLAEYALKRWARRGGWTLPSWASLPIVFSSMLALGHLLFFAPLVVDTDLSQRMLGAMQAAYGLSALPRASDIHTQGVRSMAKSWEISIRSTSSPTLAAPPLLG